MNRLRRMPSVVVLLIAAVLLVSSAQPFDRIRPWLDALSSDGRAERFTPALFHTVTLRLRWLALALVAAGVLLHVFRHPLARVAAGRVRDARDYGAELWRRALDVISSERHAHLAALASVFAVACVLRAAALSQPVNYDEAFTFITYVNRPLWVSLSDYSYPNNHLFHTVLAHATTRLFGMSPWALRLPAFAAGCLLIPLSYAVARTLWEGTTALLAATLVATSEVLIAFSTRARGYAIATACFLVMVICADDIAKSSDRRASTWLVAAATLGFFTVPTFLYSYLVIATWLLWRGRASAVVACSIVTIALVAALYLPAAMVSGLSAGAAYGYHPAASGSAVLGDIGRFATALWLDAARGLPRALAVAIVAGIGWLVVRQSASAAMLASAVLWSLIATAVQGVIPPRAWLFAVPILLIMGAAGLVLVLRGLVRAAGVDTTTVETLIIAVFVVLLCASGFRSRPIQYTEVYDGDEIAMTQDVELAALFVKDRLGGNDAVGSIFPTVDLLEYYFRLHDVPLSALKSRSRKTERYLIVTNEAIGQDLATVVSGAAIPTTSIVSTTLLERLEYIAIHEVRVRASVEP